MAVTRMTSEEIEQLLTCSRIGRFCVSIDERPYAVPVGYAFSSGEIFFHTCTKGLKMKAVKRNSHVCFEVDESFSDASAYKSVIVTGVARILEKEKEMIPYLQKLIDKYRAPQSFDDYVSKLGRSREKELASVRICVITPTQVTGRKFVS